MILDLGSKLTWFQCWDRNLLGFCLGDQNWFDFSMRIVIDLFFVRGVDIDLVFCVRAENDLFWVQGSIDLVFVWVVETDLVFMCGLWSSGDIRGTSPGFLWGYGSWSITDVAPCCWKHHLQWYFFSVVLLGNNSHLSNLCRRGWPTHLTQRCWPRAELGHLGLP